MTWTVRALGSTSAALIESSSTSLVIPPNTISPGTAYNVTFRAVYGPDIVQTESHSTLLHAVSSPLTVSVAGGTERTIARGSSLRLDPTRVSLDPDGIATTSNSVHAWRCRSVGLPLATWCPPDASGATATYDVNVPVGAISGSTCACTYRWTVQSAIVGTRSAETVVNITAAQGVTAPSVAVVGPQTANRGGGYLRVQSQVSARAGTSYTREWAVVPSVPEVALLSGLDGPSLVIDTSLLWGTEYKISLTVTQSSVRGAAALSVSINRGPAGGYLRVSPDVGVGFQTEFNLTTGGWLGEYAPFKYQFGAKSLAKIVPLTAPQLRASAVLSSLDAGNYSLSAWTIDSLGARSVPAFARVVVSSPVSQGSAACYALGQAHSIMSLVEVGAFDEAASSLRALGALLDRRSADTACYQDAIGNLTARVASWINCRGNLSKSFAEQAAVAIESLLAGTNGSYSEAAGNTTLRVLNELVATQPSLGDGTSTSTSVIRTIDHMLAAVQSCGRLDQMAAFTEEAIGVFAMSQVSGETSGNTNTHNMGARMVKIDKESGGAVALSSGDLDIHVTLPNQGQIPANASVLQVMSILPSLASACRPLRAHAGPSVSMTNTTRFSVPPFRVTSTDHGVAVPVRDLSSPARFSIALGATFASGMRYQCVFWDTAARVWSTEGCKTRTDPIERTVECMCTHFTEFALAIGEDETDSENNDVASVGYSFAGLAGLYGVLMLVVASQAFRFFYWARDRMDQINAKVTFVLLTVLCACRVILSARLAHGPQGLGGEDEGWLLLATLPYCLESWAFSLMAIQWGGIYHISIVRMRRIKFWDYGRYYVSVSSASTLAMLGAYGTLAAGVAPRATARAASTIVATLSLLLAVCFIVYGTRTGGHMLRSAGDGKLGARILRAAWGLGLLFAAESALFLASVAHSFSRQELLAMTAATYFVCLACVATVSLLFEQSLVYMRAAATAMSSKNSSRGRTGTKRSSRNRTSANGSRNSRSPHNSLKGALSAPPLFMRTSTSALNTPRQLNANSRASESKLMQMSATTDLRVSQATIQGPLAGDISLARSSGLDSSRHFLSGKSEGLDERFSSVSIARVMARMSRTSTDRSTRGPRGQTDDRVETEVTDVALVVEDTPPPPPPRRAKIREAPPPPPQRRAKQDQQRLVV